MPLFHLLILALVQGITEFLPVSSSGHLVLVHEVLNENSASMWAENLTLDVAVHVGTLFSVLVYFRRDIVEMIKGLPRLLTFKLDSGPARLNAHVLIASIPVILAGLALYMAQPEWLRNIEIMAWMTVVFGIVLGLVDKIKPAQKELNELTKLDALLIGLSQILSLIPGTSRSGITMTSARYLGFSRTDAARFSLLLSIVAIAGAGTLATKDLIESGNLMLGLDALIAMILAFISGYIAIALMMKWLSKASFMPFAVYRVLLGGLLLALIYSGVL